MAEEKITTKKTTNRGRKPKTVDSTQDKKTKELEEMKSKNKALTDMLEQMQAQMKLMQEQLNNQSNGQVVIKQNDDLTRTVKVYSMLPYTYNLSTQPLGKGKVYTFEKFGDSKSIKFSDMQDILSIYLHQFEEGFAILEAKKDYDDLGIGYIYDEVMDKEQLDNLTSLATNEAVAVILDMEEEERERIADIIARKIVSGVSYDYNRIKALEDGGIEINTVVEMLKASSSK